MNRITLPLKLMILMLIISIYACRTSYEPSPALRQQAFHAEDPITESLFKDEGSSISEEDIKRLLDGEIVLPKDARLAIYNFGEHSVSKYYSYYKYDEQYLKLKQSYMDAISQNVEGSSRIDRAMLMPSILTSSSPTITNLRESAVRVQADLLLVFKSTSDIYYRYKVFKKDEAKAFATVEAIIMDIRTGLVPFTTIVTREKLLQKPSANADMQELRKEAEQQATLQALEETAKQVVAFLNSEN